MKVRFIGGPKDGQSYWKDVSFTIKEETFSGDYIYIRREYPVGNHLVSVMALKSLSSEEVARRLEHIIIETFLEQERWLVRLRPHPARK